MNIDAARYFIELSKAGSFYAAAKGLFMSQQGLNRAITSLEDELNVKLVERSKRGVTLTSDGKRFLESAQKMLDEYNSFLGSLYGTQNPAASPIEPVNVHVTYYSSQIAASSQEYVDALRDTTCLEEPFEKIVQRALNSNGSDLSFVDLHGNTASKVLSNPDLVFEPVLATDIGIVCKKDSPLVAKSSLSRQELSALPCGSNAFKEMAQVLEWLFRDTPLQDIRVQVASPRMLLRFAQAREDGFALFDSFGFHLSKMDPSMPTDDLVFVPLSTPEARCFIGFLQPKHIRPKPRVTHIIDSLANHLNSKHADYFAEYPLVRP